MEKSETELTATKRPVWNAGRTVGAKRALKPKQIWEIRFYLNQRRRLRDRALFDLAMDSKLRGCDLVQMKIGDIVSGGQIRTRAIVMQQKTGRPVQFELLPDARASLLAWLDRRGGTVDDYVFPSRVDHNGHLSTRQYARLVDEWVTGAGLMRSEYGTHSSHYWARELIALGHEVKLMPAQYVKPYVKRGKNDAADVEAICEAVARPTMRFVGVKSPEQQSAMMLHRVRLILIPPAHPAIDRIASPHRRVWHHRADRQEMLAAQLRVVKEQILDNDRRIMASART